MNIGLKIGFFGGAFDPPHLAHVALAQAAITQAHLDQLRVVPTGQAWHKVRSLSPAEDRLRMTELAFEALPQVVVDARETQRTGPTYTIDTLLALRQENPGAEFALFIGQDQARAFTQWQRWQEILDIATVFIAVRGDTMGSNGQNDSEIDLLNAFKASTQAAGYAACRVQPLELPPMAINATDIRQRIAKGLGISHLVPTAVAGYIAQHPLLYRTA